MTVLGANFVTSCEIQLLRKPGRRPLCQIHRYPRFRCQCGQHRAYRKLRLRNSRPTVKFSTSFVEKPGQRSRLSSRRRSISLTLSEACVWTTSSQRSWRVVMHPSCSNAENHRKRMHSKLQFPRCYRQLFFFARRSDSLRVRGSTSVFSRAQQKLVRDHWSHASPGCNSTSFVAQRQSPWRNSTSHGFKRLNKVPWIQADFSKLCWTVANVVERMRTVYATISHVDLVQAVASCGGFSRKLALWWLF